MKKFLLGAGVVATVSVGSVIFTGGDIIDQVNAKVAGMFDMINQYESNENKLVDTINNLKATGNRLETQVKELIADNDNKDIEIANLNAEITELNKQIEILEQQLGSQGELAEEIIRLEGEVNKANSKVDELKTILDTQINDAPLTENELAETLMEFNGTITFSQNMTDGEIITLSDYAQLIVVKHDGPDGGYYTVTIESTTMDAFNVELGRFNGESSSGLCYEGNPFTDVIYASNTNPYQYLKINNGEFIYKLIFE